MKAEWLSDARKIPDEVMNYLRRLAVRAVEEKHYSPELIADIFGISRSSIYDWRRGYRDSGEEALDTQSAPGAPPVITPSMDHWLREAVLHSTPVDHGYDTVLWTRKILVELLNKHYGIGVAEYTVGLHLHAMRLSCQVPCYRAAKQDPAQVAAFLEVKFPKIQKLAENIGAEIAFEDESGVEVMTRSGRTWGEVGESPTVAATDQRGRDNVLSIVTGEGQLRYSLEETPMDGKRYIEFLQPILRGRPRPLIVIADNASFHRSAEVRHWVRAHRAQIRLFFLGVTSRARAHQAALSKGHSTCSTKVVCG